MSGRPQASSRRAVLHDPVRVAENEILLDEYLLRLQASELISPEAVECALNACPGLLNVENLAAWLIEHKLLTSWQHRKLLHGKFKGFFVGKYKLMQKISATGLAVVFAAEHRDTHIPVHLKVLFPDLSKRESVRRRFLKEALHRESLRHQNVVEVFDCGSAEMNAVGRLHYVATEPWEHQTLYEVVRRHSPLPPVVIADYVFQIASGLAHIHQNNIIHRNIKPQSLLVNGDGLLKIGHFSVARYLGEPEDESLSILFNESKIGTASYMAPEQILNSHRVDGRADLYSLGCTMYFLLTGKTPFGKAREAELMRRHLHDDPVPLDEVRPEVPRTLAKLCKRLMAKQPDHRPGSGNEVCHTLREWIVGSGNSSKVIGNSACIGQNETVVGVGDTAILSDADSSPLLVEEYAEQKFLLDAMFAERTVEATEVAEYRRIRRDDKTASYSVWREGFVTLLPITDYVALLPKGATRHKVVSWLELMQALGGELQELPGVIPPRIKAERFPTANELKSMRGQSES